MKEPLGSVTQVPFFSRALKEDHGMHSNGKEKKKTCTCYVARIISKMESRHVIPFSNGSCGFEPSCFEARLSKLLPPSRITGIVAHGMERFR